MSYMSLRFALLVLCWSATSHTAQAAAPDPLDGGAWVQDVEVLAAQIPTRHADPFKWSPRERFLSETARIAGAMGGIDPRSRPIKVAELVATLRDGHSFVEGYFPVLGFVPDTYPFRLYAYADGIYVQAARQSYARYLGARVVGINGHMASEVLTRVARMFPTENAMSERAWAVYGMTAPDVLRAYDVLDATDRAVFELELDGRRINVDVSALAGPQPREQAGQVVDPAWRTANAAAPRPLRAMHPEKAYWYRFDPSTGTFFVQFNEVRDRGEQGVLAFFDEVVQQVERHSVERFVLDMRWNPGGETGMNSAIVRTLLSSATINRSGRFFVLIGRRTFSSAQLICTALDEYSNAIFVGEPSGIRTHFFANTRKNVVLPHSKLGIFLSTSWWQPTNARDLQPWQRPDVAVDELFDDYANGRDPALGEVLRYRPPVDLAAVFAGGLQSEASDWEQVIALYRQFKADTRSRYVDTEAMVNDLGYALREAKRAPLALRFFEFNVRDYPDSANAHDSLAEAYEAAGRLTDSRSHYAHAVELALAAGADAEPHRQGLSRMEAKLAERR